MNGREAAFLRKVAKYTNSSYRELKRGWNKISHSNKAKVRKNLQAAVDAAEGKANV